LRNEADHLRINFHQVADDERGLEDEINAAESHANVLNSQNTVIGSELRDIVERDYLVR